MAEEKSSGAMEANAPPVIYSNVPSQTPTFFADTCIFATGMGANTVRLQFAEFVPGAMDGNDPGTKVRYVGTLVMPLDGFKNMVEYLNTLMPVASDGD